jgi:hypothetical protein
VRIDREVPGWRLVVVRAMDVAAVRPWIDASPELRTSVVEGHIGPNDLVVLPVADREAWEALAACVAPLGFQPGPEPIADLDINGVSVYSFTPLDDDTMKE